MELEHQLNTLRQQIARLERDNSQIKELSKKLHMQGLIDNQTLYDIAKAIVQGVEGKHSENDILDQIKLVLDRESQKAIIEGRYEYKEGKARIYKDVKDLLKDLKASND
jgi:hypothetical protein